MCDVPLKNAAPGEMYCGGVLLGGPSFMRKNLTVIGKMACAK